MLPKQIFIVEDEGVVAADLEDSLKSLGYDVAGKAATGEDAVARVSQIRPDIVLMDIILRGEMDGIKAAEIIRRDFDIPVVFLTSHADNATVGNACVTQPFGYILKPYDEQELRVTLEIALYRHKAEAKLRKMERWLTTTLESIGDGVIATDIEGNITFMNPKAERLTGWSADQANGHALMEVFSVHNARDGKPLFNPVLEAIRGGDSVAIPRDTVLRSRAGKVVPVDDCVAPIRDKGVIVGAVLVFRDCTESVRAEAEIRALNDQLELRVKERTAELMSVNKELESFSYSVAHDLRAPLRAINGFSSLLFERYKEQFDEEGNRLLNVVQESARRMGQMVDDFLGLARVGRQSVHLVPVDMNTLVQSVTSDFPRDTKDPVVRCAPLPFCHGDSSLLRQVWANLISNAVKFSRGRPSPSIEIGGREEGNEVVYWVRDNGVGFDMEFHERLFETFQRLHPPTQFEGTGVGLAIVRKIIDRHGGRVWAEGRPGEGATFFFGLPKPGRVRPVSGSLQPSNEAHVRST